MSREMSYFPPQGTKYKWEPPVLRNRGWSANIPSKGQFMLLKVYRNDDGFYYGTYRLHDLYGKIHENSTELFEDPKDALLATETLGDKILSDQNLPKWVDEALELGWRPPK